MRTMNSLRLHTSHILRATATIALAAGGAVAAAPGAAAADGGSVGDRVWIDENYNGIQDDGEPGAAGITVTVYDILGEFAGKTVTDADGNYTVSGLSVGSYYVEFTGLPRGAGWTWPNVGDDDEVDSDVDQEWGMTMASIDEPGQIVTNLDAGMVRVAVPK